jgi:hypothetical protein
MRLTFKPLLAAATIAAFTFACSDLNDSDSLPMNKQDFASADAEERQCASDDVLKEQLKDNPGQAKKMDDIERHIKKFIDERGGETAAASALANGTVLTIPVVVNVIYNTAQQNISDAQIASQIAVLNQDFRASNSDLSNLASTTFAGLGSDFEIQFNLVATNRKQSNKSSWGTRDAMKNSKKGGIDATSPTTHLNIWVCNIGGGILGYAQFPGGNASTDGVVIGPNYFGTTNYAGSGSFYLSAPFNKGRTATHEVGHWINLRHIWGDANCGNDQVSDTPTHNTANYGCPTYPHLSTCAGTPIEMTMNYMDYTDDACMYMFSPGQKVRARAVFAAGGPRATFAP